jgi:hypothetical protein
MHDMDVEQDDSVFQVDFNAFQDADRKLVSRFAAISASVDLRLLHAEVETAASTLASVGVASARYWALDEANGTLTAYQGDDSVATLNPYQSELLMDFSRDSIQSFGARNADSLQNPHSVFTWLQSHPAYHAVRNVATHGLGARRFDGRSTSQQLGDSSTADVAVHAIKITSRCTGSPNFGKTVGILLVTEPADQTLPFGSTSGDHNMLKLRRYMVLQLLQKLALAVESRVSMFDAQREQAELVRFIEETRSALGQKDLDLHQKDGIIATREGVLRAKDVHALCSDALATCATLLSESKLQSSVIASAVAKSGCIRDKSQHNLSNCWLLFKENDYLPAAGSTTSYYSSEHQSVCAVSGFLRDGHSPVSLISSQNKLITRLLHGDYSAQNALRVTATRQELHDAGLVIAELEHANSGSQQRQHQWAQSFTAVAVSMQVQLVDRLAYNCPGHCRALAAVVIVIPENEETELFASHAVSLAHLAQRGFASVQAWKEAALRQSLLSISSELYEAVITVAPVPASEIYSSPQKGRSAENEHTPAAPVYQPHYQRALMMTMSKLGSADLAAKFTVRRSALLVSDICAAQWKLHNPPAEARKLSFLHAVGGALQALSCPTADLSVTSWLQDLYSGKIVYYDSAESQRAFASALPEAYNVELSLRGAVARQSRMVSPPYVQAQQLLKTLVHAVDPHAAYCALIPIRIPSGLSVLMLFDKLTASPTDGHSTVVAARGDVIPFSAAYMEALLAAKVCKDLTQALVIIQQQSSAYWAERELSEEVESLGVREEKLCALVANVRQRSEVATCFARWRHAATRSVDQLALSKHRTVLSAVLALVTHRFQNRTAESSASFLAVLEDQLRVLYPLDSITIVANANVAPQSNTATTAVQIYEDAAHITLQREISYTVSDVGSTSKSVRRSLATVRVSRPVLLNRPFLPGEVKDLGIFCTIAGDVYGALTLGHSTDLADGDVRSLVFPMLRQVVPGLLSTAQAGPPAHALLPLLVRWLKRTCAADMVLLRLNPLREGEGEILLSSEEVDDAQVDRLQGRLGNLSDLAAQLAQGTDDGAGVSVDASAHSTSDSILLKLLHPSADGGVTAIGEVKVLSSTKRQFTAEQSVVVQVVSYLLAYVLRCDAQTVQTAAREAQLVAERQQLHTALTAAKQSAQVEAQSADAFKARLASILSTVMLTDKVAAVASLEDLAALVCEGIPRLVGVSSAVLVVDAQHVSTGNTSQKAPAGMYRIVLPRSTRASDTLDTSSHTAAANSTMTLQQLQQIPVMFANPAAMQCKIDLFSPADDSLFGSILLFRKPLVTSAGTSASATKEQEAAAATYALWEGLEDILRNALSTAIYQCTARITASSERDDLSRALHRSNAILQDQAHLEPDVANLLGIKADLEEQRTTLQAEVASLRTKMEQILADRKSKLGALESEIATLKTQSASATERSRRELSAMEATLASEREAQRELTASKQKILELVSSYSYDHRCEHDSILLWLREVAETAQVTLQLVGQTGGGALSGAEGIRGIASAVGEAVRSGLTVEYITTVANSTSAVGSPLADAHLHSTVALRYTRSDGRSADAMQLLNFSPLPGSRSPLFGHGADTSPGAAEYIAVLCVPNRSAAARSNTEHACFVFIKAVSGPEGAFSTEEKDLLNCAVNLSSRTLVQTAAQQTDKEFRRLEASLREARTAEAYVKRVIALADSLRRQEYATFEDVNSRVRVAVQELLQRGERDTCIVESALWLPPWNSAADSSVGVVRSTSAASADQDALTRVLSTGGGVRRRSCCWLPLVNNRGEIRAILRTERRFSDSAELAMDSPVSSIDGDGSTLPTVAHLVITDLEEEMLTLFATLSVPLLEKMDLVGEAYHSVQQAGQAIAALQTVKEAVEDRCASEVSHRLQLEDSLKAAAEMLGMTHSARASTDQLLDATRKSILAFTSSVDCFVIMPVAEHGANRFAGARLGEQQYCTFTSDLPREIRVVFEPGDLEAATMQNFGSLRSVSSTHYAGAASGNSSVAGVKAWQSWAVRRVQARTSFELDEAGALQDNNDMGSVSTVGELFTLAVPFAMRSGAVAVISIVRRSAPFTVVDRECVTWVSKVLAYCLEMQGGEESVAETLQQVKGLQEELSHLRQIDARLAAVEEGEQALESTLSTAKYAPTLLRELDTVTQVAAEVPAKKVESAAVEAVAAAARAAFGPSAVADAWSDADSVAGWHVKMKALPKATVSCESGTVTYWADSGAEVEESVASELGVFKEGETRMRFRRQQEALHAEEASVTLPTLFLQVNAHGYSRTWLEVVLEPKLQEHVKLRIAVLMQLLQAAEPWRKKTLELHQRLLEAQQTIHAERESAAEALDAKHSEVESLKATFVSNLGGTKDKYKSIVVEKSASYRRAERIFTETLLYARTLRGLSLPTKGKPAVGDSAVQTQVLDVFYQFGRAIEHSGGLSVTVGKCALSGTGTLGTFSQPLVVPARPAAVPSTRGRDPQLEGLEWLSAPSQSPPTAPAAQAGPSQQAAIHVEVYGGATHTNPLQIALATGNTVLFLPDPTGGESPHGAGSVTATRDAMLSVCRKLDPDTVPSGNPSHVCLNPTEQFPLYSVIVPVTLNELGITVLVVVKPTAERGSNDEVTSKYVLYSALAGIFTLKQAARDLLRQQATTAEAVHRTKKLAVHVLKQSSLSEEVSRKTKALVFEKMRSARLGSRLAAASAVHTQLTASRAQVRHLEQLNADWTEMVKGLTGASGGIQTGVMGLWAQACPTLMDLLSSHVKLVGCGLLVASDGVRGGSGEENIVEYTVRELNTPLSTHAGRQRRSLFSPATVGEIEDYSRGALESRPASDLGSMTHNLVKDIFAGRTGAQRIFKLSRGRHAQREDASEWLVPVRTARSVLAVLRVTVDATSNTGGAAATTDVASSQTEATEVAQSNLINFAEVLAPLHLAAQVLDKSKQLTTRFKQDAQRATDEAKAAALEAASAHKRTSLLANAVKCIGGLSRSELHLPFTAPEECLQIFCKRVGMELSQQLHCRVIVRLHANILHGPASSTDSAAMSVAPTAAAGELSESLLDAQGKPFGSVSIVLPNTATAHAERSGDAGTTARKLYTSPAGKGPASTAHLAYVLQALVTPLSGLLLRTAREISSKSKLANAEDAVRALEEALQREQESSMQLQQTQLQQIESSDFHRALAGIRHECLMYCNADPEERDKYPGEGDSYTFKPCASLIDLLQSFCVKLPSLVGNGCAFRFVLLDSKHDSRAHQATLVHATKENALRALDWHNLGADTRNTVASLAEACIAKRSKTVCDIGVAMDALLAPDVSSQRGSVAERLSVVRVLSYPLMDPHSPTVLGVLQCIVEPANMRSLVEDLCEDVTHCVACTLSVEAHQQKLHGKVQKQALQLLTMEDAVNQSLQLKEMWEQRSRAWSGLCQLATKLTQAVTSERQFSDIIGSEAVVSILSDAGVRVSLRHGPVSEAHRRVLALSSGTVLAHSIIPVDDAGDLVAEIVCERPSMGTEAFILGSEELGVATIAGELVGTVEGLLRDALVTHKLMLHARDASRHTAHASHKVDRLKAELRSAREQLQIATAEADRLALELQIQAHKHQILKSNTATAVNNPAVRAMAAQIQKLSEALNDASSTGSEDLASILSNFAVKAAGSTATSRTGFGESKQPDASQNTAPTSTTEDASAEQVTTLIMQPIAGLINALRTALVRSSTPQEPLSPSKVLLDKGTVTGVPSNDTAGGKRNDKVSYKIAEETRLQIEHTLQQLAQTRRVHKVVCREAALLMDPPTNLINDRDTRHDAKDQSVAHPAHVTPLAAAHDCCLKVLTLLRTLLRSEGQAVLLKDHNSDPESYQVIYTGDALKWTGVTPATFGVVASQPAIINSNGIHCTSLAQVAMQTRKTLNLPDASQEPQYNAYIDGVCGMSTPMLIVPVRGRSNAVVGVLIAARGKSAATFSADDIMAAEVCSALGALSLYWCQGMGTLHHEMALSKNKAIRLEKQLEKLQVKEN